MQPTFAPSNARPAKPASLKPSGARLLLASCLALPVAFGFWTYSNTVTSSLLLFPSMPCKLPSVKASEMSDLGCLQTLSLSHPINTSR